ncbi:MAG: uroporphyrinogen-III synthase [Micropepsaceae bacterium]
MRILITRPEPDAGELASRLEAQGHTVLVEPLISIAFESGPQFETREFQALVFTSANGARAAAQRVESRSIPVFTVGPASAEAADKLGFSAISQSAGNGLPDLVAHIRATVRPEAGSLLHVTGSHVAGDLAGALAAFGYKVERKQAYRSEASTALSDQLQAELRQELISAAMFFSPRTAETFAALCGKAGLTGACEKVAAFALSHNVAKSLKPLTFRKLLVAQNATVGAMLELLKSL